MSGGGDQAKQSSAMPVRFQCRSRLTNPRMAGSPVYLLPCQIRHGVGSGYSGLISERKGSILCTDSNCVAAMQSADESVHKTTGVLSVSASDMPRLQGFGYDKH